jgi:hypothetical protein
MSYFSTATATSGDSFTDPAGSDAAEGPLGHDDDDDKLSSMPELSHLLSTIEESAESLDSPGNSSRQPSGLQTPIGKAAFQASRANSHSRGGFNDSSSTIDGDFAGSHDSAGNGAADGERTGEDGATLAKTPSAARTASVEGEWKPTGC